MKIYDQYAYVDGHYEHGASKRRTVWVRMHAREVNKLVVQPAKSANCFSTVQRFKDSVSDRDRQKTSKLTPEEQRRENEVEPELYGDHQAHYHGLYFDFDASPERLGISEAECLARSREEAVRVALYFKARFDFADVYMQAWFSGKKGFHLTVRPELFDVRPHRNLSYIVQKVALDLINELGLTTLDRSVYSIPRMWRIPNTIHVGTGKFKIELTLLELMNEPIEKIVALAQTPRIVATGEDYLLTGIPGSHLYGAEEYVDILRDTSASAWWGDYVIQYEAGKEMKNLRPRVKIERPEGIHDDYPLCVQDILAKGAKPGSVGRNRVLIPLVAFFKDAGIEQDFARSTVEDWTRNHFGDDRKQLKARRANGLSVVESVYRGPNYGFSCASMLSNHGTGTEGRIACAGPDCKWIKTPTDQTPLEIPRLHLAEASRGAYHGTRVQIPVHVCGVARSPFIVPRKIRLLCEVNGKGEYCKGCPGASTNGVSQCDLDAHDREMLSLIDVNDPRRKGTLRAKMLVPGKCQQHRFEELLTGNVQEVQMIPMVDFAYAYEEEKEGVVGSNKLATRHVVRRGFHVGHDLEPNKKYLVEAYPYRHPEDQSAVFVFDKAESAQNDIDQFKMTPDLMKRLKIFQRKPGQSVGEKMEEIHKDFEANVHHIRGRIDLSIAVDLCFHSVIGFRFQGADIHKGYFELLVVGDSGTGKSTLVERIQQHYGLGEIIAGEEAKRTGLIYSSQQLGGAWVVVWGKIPQNDRRLLVIDEFAAIPMEEVGKLTQLRSEGKARGQGVASNYETFARTRLIFLSNPRNGQSLSSFNYGIEAVRDIFLEHQDLRRTDWAICVKSDDVPTNVINQEHDSNSIQHVYTADICRQSVLWAWSRDPQHVEFLPGVERRILWWAEQLGKTYACDIYLADRSDMRLKIARIAASVAATLFSTDEDGRKVLIDAEHVDYAAERIDKAYRKKAMAFFEYARMHQSNNTFSETKLSALHASLQAFQDPDVLVATLLGVTYFSKKDIEELTSWGKEELDKLWRFLVHNQLVQKKVRGYKKSPAFTDLLKEIASVHSGYGAPPEESKRPPVERVLVPPQRMPRQVDLDLRKPEDIDAPRSAPAPQEQEESPAEEDPGYTRVPGEDDE